MSKSSNDKSVQILVKLGEGQNSKLSKLLSDDLKGVLSKANAIDLIVKDFLEQDSTYQTSILRQLGASNFYSLSVDYTFGLAQGDHYFNSNRFLDCVEIYENIYEKTNSESDIYSAKIKQWCAYRLSYVLSSLAIEIRKSAIQKNSGSHLKYALKCINESINYNQQLLDSKESSQLRFGLINLFNMACILSLKAQFSAELVYLNEELTPSKTLEKIVLDEDSPSNGNTQGSIDIFNEIKANNHSSLNQIQVDGEQAIDSLEKLFKLANDSRSIQSKDAQNNMEPTILYRISSLMKNDTELTFLRALPMFSEKFNELCELAQSRFGSMEEWLKQRYDD